MFAGWSSQFTELTYYWENGTVTTIQLKHFEFTSNFYYTEELTVPSNKPK